MSKCNGRTRAVVRVGRRLGIYGAIAALLVAAGGAAGCSNDEIAKEFRTAALGSVESGVKSIVDGVITGLFTVATPDETTSGT